MTDGPRIIWTGTFEPEFSRNRKLSRLLELGGCQVTIIRVPVWRGDRIDLAQTGKARAFLRFALAVPELLWRLWRAPRPDLYLVSYPGWFDMPWVRLLSALKSRPVLFDPFISLYDTMVTDRKLVTESSWIGRMVRVMDRWSLRAASHVLADTGPHLAFYDSLAPGVIGKGSVLPIGADDLMFSPTDAPSVVPRRVVFHGTFVPLQGLATVVEAAKLLESQGVSFEIIGDGQDRPLVELRVEELDAQNVALRGRIPPREIPAELASGDVCLGVFGLSEKAARVVPHKVYEGVAMSRPVVTRCSPAIDEAFTADEIVTVPAGSADDLAEAIIRLLEDPERMQAVAVAGHRRYMRDYHEEALTRSLMEVIHAVTAGRDY